MIGPRLAMVAFACLLAGCAVGPNFHTPAAPTSSGYGPGEPSPPIPGQTVNRGAQPSSDWWRAFGSAELDALVREALAPNPVLKYADAALRQAH